MKQTLLSLFFLISASLFPQKLSDVVGTMPNAIVPGLPENDRTMLLADTGRISIPFALGKIEREAFTSDFLRIKTSKVGTTQIKLLPLINGTKIICVIKTVCAAACDSNIKFYSSDWIELDSKTLIPHISIESFIEVTKKNSENNKFALSLLDICPVSAEFENGSSVLTMKLHVEKYLSGEQLTQIKPFLKTVTLNWDNTSFK